MELTSTSDITFIAIKHFVDDLVSVFGSGGGRTPLGLYNRLISHVEGRDSSQGVDKYISGFKVFFSDYGDNLDNIEALSNIPRDTIIKYGDSDKVFLEIQKYIYKSKTKPEQLESIRQHLITISVTIKPDENALVALEKTHKLDSQPSFNIGGGNESGFVKQEMDNIREVLERENIDMSDPMNGIMTLMQSGAITGMIGRLKDGVDAGQLDPNKMLSGLQSTLTDMMSTTGEDAQVDMNDIMNQASQVMLAQGFNEMMNQMQNNGVHENNSNNQVNEVEDVD